VTVSSILAGVADALRWRLAAMASPRPIRAKAAPCERQ